MSKLFFAPAAGRAAEVRAGGDVRTGRLRSFPAAQAQGGGKRHQVRPPRLVASEATSAAPAAPASPREVGAARRAHDDFEQIFSDVTARFESESRERFLPPPATAYSSRARELVPAERLGWWNGGSHLTQRAEAEAAAYAGERAGGAGVAGAFQDQRPSSKRHVGGHWPTEESVVSLLQEELSLRSESESARAYKPPPAGWSALKPRHEPPETIQLEFSPQPAAELGADELQRLRLAFQAEMGRLHNTDAAAPGQSEQHAAFAAPAAARAAADAAAAAESAAAAARQRAAQAGAAAVSEHEAAFAPPAARAMRAAQLEAAPAAGRRSALEAPLALAAAAPTAPPPSTEYAASFLSRPKAERLAAKASAERLAAELRAAERRERERAALEAEASRSALALAEGLSPRRASATSPLSEYRERFSQQAASPSPEQPQQRARRLPGSGALASEYNVEFDHAPPGGELRKARAPLAPLGPDDLGRGFVSEYEGRFCGVDEQALARRAAEQAAAAAKRTALSPAHSLAPDAATNNKHHLFAAEINPGYVARTEYMRSFSPPPKSKAEEQQQRSPKAEQMDERTLNRWRNQGQRLWTASNPLTQNLRYAPYDNLFKTPQTESQAAFARHRAAR